MPATLDVPRDTRSPCKNCQAADWYVLDAKPDGDGFIKGRMLCLRCGTTRYFAYPEPTPPPGQSGVPGGAIAANV